MNFELMPCHIKGCEDAGRYTVKGKEATIYVCAAHALEIAERHEQAKEEVHHAPD